MNAHPTTNCPTCGGALLSVSIEMTDGAVLYRTCPSCELRWWERNGTPIDRTKALAHLPRR